MTAIKKELATSATLTIQPKEHTKNASKENLALAILSLVIPDYESTEGLTESLKKDIQHMVEWHYLCSLSGAGPQILEINQVIRPEMQEVIIEGPQSPVSLSLHEAYSPALLLNYFISGLYQIKPSLQFDKFDTFKKNLRLKIEDPQFGHTLSGEYFYRCMGPALFNMVPQDENGVIYAINPIFEMSKKDVVHLIIGDSFDLAQFVEYIATTILTRLTTPGADIPVAHADYQNPVVLELGGLQYGGGYSQCTCCGEAFFDVNKWLFKDGMIVAYPQFQDHCAALNTKTVGEQPSVRAFTVDMPTGDLFFADWLRDEKGFGISSLPDHRFDINFPYARLQASNYYANHNVVYGSIGNEACRLYSNEEGSIIYVLGHLADPKVIDQLNVKYVGRICTDLWGYTMADRAYLEPLSSPAYLETIQAIQAPRETHHWDEPGMLRVKPGQYWHYYFNAYEDDIMQSAKELPESIRQVVLALNPNALHGVLVHKDLIK